MFFFNYYKIAFNAMQRGRRHLTQRSTRWWVDSVHRNPSQRSRQGGELSHHLTISSCCPEIESVTDVSSQTLLLLLFYVMYTQTLLLSLGERDIANEVVGFNIQVDYNNSLLIMGNPIEFYQSGTVAPPYHIHIYHIYCREWFPTFNVLVGPVTFL